MRSPAVLLLVMGLCTVMGVGAAAADSGTAAEPHSAGSSSPPEANDWQCIPEAGHPEPVVLVHGTWGNRHSWDALAPKLKAAGHCVFALDYGRDTSSLYGSQPGVYGTGDIRASSGELAEFIERVRAATRSERVDIVAHSQGGLVARQYMRFGGGVDPAAPERNTVRQLITVGATNHGTTASNLGYLLPTGSAAEPSADMVARVLGPAAAQQLVGSEFLNTLNAGGDTEPGVRYTVVASRFDEISTPPEATFLQAGPGALVNNIWVQNVCAADTFDHGRLLRSPTVIQIVQAALDPTHTAARCAG
ncbi:triacylglycerol lipase [Nocardia sp. BMG51109]|uniref:esterase/lipase family protein n=1 Tax=Nocardia sp. BMG51109 TaxID=1056816 RepID=UPI000463E0FD|nr:alpha/beta fold hydrolase [Nocardia sp. BMG51109]